MAAQASAATRSRFFTHPVVVGILVAFALSLFAGHTLRTLVFVTAIVATVLVVLWVRAQARPTRRDVYWRNLVIGVMAGAGAAWLLHSLIIVLLVVALVIAVFLMVYRVAFKGRVRG